MLTRANVLTGVSIVVGILLAEFIGRFGGAWVFVGWLVGCQLMFVPHMIYPREGMSRGPIIVLGVFTGILAGGVVYLMQL